MNRLLYLIFISLQIFAATVAYSQTNRQDSARKSVSDKQLFFDSQIKEGLERIDFSHARKTVDTSLWFDLPVVVHMVHDYGLEYLTDDEIFNDIGYWNQTFSKQNWDTIVVIQPFKKWIGNAHIRLHLASIDPNGNPTKGITRRRSYLTYGPINFSSVDQWPPDTYINIWIVNGLSTMGGYSLAGVALLPRVASAYPYWDGIECTYSYVNANRMMEYLLGEYFNLYHVNRFFVRYGYGSGMGYCGDDSVDDTPPTLAHINCSDAELYDTTCATGYMKVYPSVLHPGTDSLVDYPDTANTQNIMDWGCRKMFTLGQTVRMNQCLNREIAGRNNLWTPANLESTGALQPRPDLQPIPAFAAMDTGAIGILKKFEGDATPKYFIGCNTEKFPKAKILFMNESWNDTISYVKWLFSNAPLIDSILLPGDTTTNDTSSYSGMPFIRKPHVVKNGFRQPGWVTITLTATDTSGMSKGRPNNTATTVFENAVFVTDSTGVDATQYYEEFNPLGDADKWPTFNYYNNEFKWQMNTSLGFDDGFCMMYQGFDYVMDPENYIYRTSGTPGGDFDDMFSVPVDFTKMNTTDSCYLNFMYSGATRASNLAEQNDSLVIGYSIDAGNTWHSLHTMKKEELDNAGVVSTNYVPTSSTDWAPMSVSLPAAARTDYTLFCFRYYPGVDANTQSSGNNFYIDRISFNPWQAAAPTISVAGTKITLAPNPTHGDVWLTIDEAQNEEVDVVVTDLQGKTVFTTQQAKQRILIPHSILNNSGIYLVYVHTAENSTVLKMVVY